MSVTIKTGKGTYIYEHPYVVRLCHWANAISLFVLVGSGLRIFWAFPSFADKVPERDLFDPPKLVMIGDGLAGALQWHLTFASVFVVTGLLYVVYQALSRNFRQVLFVPRDISGVWPMVRHYFFFGPKPEVTAAYNPLQKLAYTSAIGFGILSALSGLVLYKPVQFWWLAWLMGGFHLARVWHFLALCGFLSFIPGHLIMVLLHGWQNFYSMVVGWKRDPEYLR